MLLYILSNFVQVFSFFYIFWRRVKEDYKREDVLTACFYVVIGGYLGYVISRFTEPTWWFWMSFCTSFLGLLIATHKFNFKIYEVLDAYAVSGLSLFSAILLFDWVRGSKLSSGIGFIIGTIFIFVFFLIDRRYKGLTWYRSGRVGFSGLSILTLFFLLRAAVALITADVISFVGNADTYLSLPLAFLSLFAIYRLSKRKL
jgi:hypothetical protein